jgi:hypothetical protein
VQVQALAGVDHRDAFNGTVGLELTIRRDFFKIIHKPRELRAEKVRVLQLSRELRTREQVPLAEADSSPALFSGRTSYQIAEASVSG